MELLNVFLFSHLHRPGRDVLADKESGLSATATAFVPGLRPSGFGSRRLSLDLAILAAIYLFAYEGLWRATCTVPVDTARHAHSETDLMNLGHTTENMFGLSVDGLRLLSRDVRGRSGSPRIDVVLGCMLVTWLAGSWVSSLASWIREHGMRS